LEGSRYRPAALAVLSVLLLDSRSTGRDGDHEIFLGLDETLKLGLLKLISIHKDRASRKIVNLEFSRQDGGDSFFDPDVRCARERDAKLLVLEEWQVSS
jgi:hypothetical protein